MEDNLEAKSSIKTPVGSKATRVPDRSLVQKANASIFLTLKGISEDHTEDTLKNTFKNYLKEEHKDLVVDVKKAKNRKDLMIIYCKDWEASDMIASTYKNKFMNCEVTFSLFSKSNAIIGSMP